MQSAGGRQSFYITRKVEKTLQRKAFPELLKNNPTMLRLASNRVTGKFSSINLKSAAERRFSSKPPLTPPINMKPKAKGGGDGVATSVAALVAIMLVTAAPVVYVKMEKIQLDPRIENIIGTIFGTHAVLFLRPDGHQNDLSPSLYKSVTEIDGFNDNSDVSGEQSTSADETLEQVAGQKSAESASTVTSSKSTSVNARADVEAVARGEKVAGKESSTAEKGDGKVESKSDEELVCPMPAKKAVPIEEAVCPMPPNKSGAAAGAVATTSGAGVGASAKSSVAATTGASGSASAGVGATHGSVTAATGSSVTSTTAATAAGAATVASAGAATVASAGAATVASAAAASGSSSAAPSATSKSGSSSTSSAAVCPVAPGSTSASTSTLAAEKAGKAGTTIIQIYYGDYEPILFFFMAKQYNLHYQRYC
jgi:hypothetical protein